MSWSQKYPIHVCTIFLSKMFESSSGDVILMEGGFLFKGKVCRALLIWGKVVITVQFYVVPSIFVVYGDQNGPTRLYLTRRIDWCRFHNHTTIPWWSKNALLVHQILYGYKGWWYNKMVSSTLYMGPLGNILLANTKTFYSECRLWLHKPRFQLALHIQCSGWSGMVCSFCIQCCTLCTTYQKRIWKRKKSGLCALSLLCTTIHSHRLEFSSSQILSWNVQHCMQKEHWADHWSRSRALYVQGQLKSWPM